MRWTDNPLVSEDATLRLGTFTRRRSDEVRRFTRFDGRIADDSIPSPVSGGALSPTSFRPMPSAPAGTCSNTCWASTLSIGPRRSCASSPIDRGSLMHEVLERFIGRQLSLPRAERIRPQTPWSAADHEHLDELTRRGLCRLRTAGSHWSTAVVASGRAVHPTRSAQLPRRDDRHGKTYRSGARARRVRLRSRLRSAGRRRSAEWSPPQFKGLPTVST